MNLLDQFITYLLSQKKQPSKLTVKNYKADVSQFIRWYEQRFSTQFTPEGITSLTIELYKKAKTPPNVIPNSFRNLTGVPEVKAEILKQVQDDTEKMISPRSLERHLSSLRKFFHFLKIEGTIGHSPFEPAPGTQQPATDHWKLKDFKDHLYVYNASNLTIKNYLIDVKQFFSWAEEVTKVKDNWEISQQDIFKHLDANFIEEYKQRLLTQTPLSPISINRKLSSIRRYMRWAQSEGLLPENVSKAEKVSNVSNEAPFDTFDTSKPFDTPIGVVYSSFPPFRLAQKIAGMGNTLFDDGIVAPIGLAIEKGQEVLWKLKGKPIFQEIQNSKLQCKI